MITINLKIANYLKARVGTELYSKETIYVLPKKYFIHLYNLNPNLEFKKRDLKFSTDWNWLIPACKAIRDYKIEITQYASHHVEWGNESHNSIALDLFKLDTALDSLEFTVILNTLKEIL